MIKQYYYVVKTVEPDNENNYLYLSNCRSFFNDKSEGLIFTKFDPQKHCRYFRKEDALFDIECYIRDHHDAKITDFTIVTVEAKETTLNSPLFHYICFNCDAYNLDPNNLKSEDIREAIYERYHIKVKTFSYNTVKNTFDGHISVRVLSNSLVLEEE